MPASARRSPVIRLNSVVLPAPFGPMIRRRSPGATSSETSLIAGRPPNAFFRPVISSAGAVTIAAPSSAAHQRRTPGTTPSGMNITMTTKTKPSSMFQRSMYAET